MKYFFDTEFMEDGKTIELLSIGMVCEDGRELYLENNHVDWRKANAWVRENVIPHLHKAHPDFYTGLGHTTWIAQEILKFIGDDKPEFWAYYGAYDWVLLCQLYGPMVDLPAGWPMFCMDLKQLAVTFGDPKLYPQTSTEHHALNDARWVRDAWKHLDEVRKYWRQ